MPPLISLVRKEWSEFRQDILTHETLYFCEAVLGKLESRSGGIKRKSEYELGRFRYHFDLTFVSKRNHHLRCWGVIERAPRRFRNIPGSELELNDRSAVADGDMLVEIRQFVQLPEGMRLEVLPSLIRLKGLDDLDSGTRYLPGSPLESFPVLVAVAGMNREATRPTGDTTTEQAHLPRQVVQGRPKRMGELANQDGKSGLHVMQDDLDDVKSAFKIVMFPDGVWVRRERRQVRVDSLEVVCRPLRFHMRTSQAGYCDATHQKNLA